MRKHPLYTTWYNMKRRCYDPKNISYKNYGARGIIVCDRWLNSFENFLKDMGDKPSKQHSIDRIDNNGNYEPSNCKWSCRKEQNNNKRTYKTSKTKYTGIRKVKSGGYQVRTKGTNRKLLGVFENLKEAIKAQKENIKQTKPRLNNSTGTKGVTKQGDSFLVRKMIDGKRVYLGNCKTLEDAKKLYNSGIKQDKNIYGDRDEFGRFRKKD